MNLKKIRKGFINLNNSNYKGKIWIEIFIIENVTDSYENIKGIIDFLKENKIRYDKIQLNTIDRVGADRNLKAISYFKLLEIEKIFKENNILNVEIIKKLDELDEKNKISINNELLNNMKQKRKYQQEEIDKIFKK